jgi:hypothetical protein
MIGFPGRIGRGGKRPRLKFTTRQRRRTSYLAAIDAALKAAKKSSGWLHRKIVAAPFARRSPVDRMVMHGMAGASDVLQHLTRLAMRAALAAPSEMDTIRR